MTDSFFKWDDTLSLGIDQMDQEHQTLIAYMNDLFKANEEKAGKLQLQTILDKLLDATTNHFRDEEAFMDSMGFPHAANHKVIHKNLLEKLNGFAVGFAEGSEEELSEEFFKFLKFWLSAHIRGIDQKYSAFHHGAEAA